MSLRQHLSPWGVAASVSLHGLCVAALFSHPSPATGPDQGGDAPGRSIAVSLVSPAEAGGRTRAAPVTSDPTTVPFETPVDQPVAAAGAESASLNSGRAEPASGAPSTSASATARTASPPASMDPTTAANYRLKLLAHIQPFRRYPEQADSAGARGVVQLMFTVDQDGKVTGVWVTSSSGVRALDEEAVATVMRAQPMPHIPHGLPDPLAVQLPVSFSRS